MMRNEAATELVLLPFLKAHRARNGRLVVTQKYLDGAAEYAKSWPGPVVSLFDVSDRPSSDMDHVEVGLQENGHSIEVRPRDPGELEERLQSAAVAVGFLSSFEAETTKLCNRLRVPVVHVSEYTLKTDWQIIDTQRANPVRKLRRKLWAWQEERGRRWLIGISAGLQCNGTPTYDAYRSLCPDALLYFDNRVRAADIISPDALQRKADQVRKGAPLQLAFGGRLVPMKGALYLPDVARALRRRGVPFHLSIYGRGPDEAALKGLIAKYDLADQVTLHAPMDFRTGWVPLLKNEPDLFVCCHPQGDPSSTYCEVSSCGVPIAGFDNEAFNGFRRLSGAGFIAPTKDTEKLAQVIAELDGDRDRLVDAARKARDYAIQHHFEATFARRTKHFMEKSRLPPALRGAG